MSTSTTVSRRGFVAAAGTAAVATAAMGASALASESSAKKDSSTAADADNAVSDWGVEYPWPAGPPASRLTWRP